MSITSDRNAEERPAAKRRCSRADADGDDGNDRGNNDDCRRGYFVSFKPVDEVYSILSQTTDNALPELPSGTKSNAFI